MRHVVETCPGPSSSQGHSSRETRATWLKATALTLNPPTPPNSLSVRWSEKACSSSLRSSPLSWGLKDKERLGTSHPGRRIVSCIVFEARKIYLTIWNTAWLEGPEQQQVMKLEGMMGQRCRAIVDPGALLDFFLSEIGNIWAAHFCIFNCGWEMLVAWIEGLEAEMKKMVEFESYKCFRDRRIGCAQRWWQKGENRGDFEHLGGWGHHSWDGVDSGVRRRGSEIRKGWVSRLWVWMCWGTEIAGRIWLEFVSPEFGGEFWSKGRIVGVTG